MQLFIYVKPSSLPPRIPELIPLRKQMLYYMRAGKLRLIWRLLRLLVSQWLVGEETAGMNCTAPHRQCALWPCFTFWTPALLFLQGGMELEPLLLNKQFGGMSAGTSRQTLLRCCSLRRKMRPYRAGHSKVRGQNSFFGSCCCRGLFPPSRSLCCSLHVVSSFC